MSDDLPSSRIRADDYPPGPNGMARHCEDRIAELVAAKAEYRTRAERRPINQHLTLRDLLRFAKSRAGYVETPQDLGLLEPGKGPHVSGPQEPLADGSQQ